MTGTDGQGAGPASKPRRKPGPPKGIRHAGRQKGTKNKATIQREKIAQLEAEKRALEEKARESGSPVDRAVAGQHRLLKDVGADLARLYAGLAAFYQPHPTWHLDPATSKMVNANPNYDEARFRHYAEMAMQGARDFARFESPQFAAVMIQSQVVNHVTVTGGMPDEFEPPAPGRVQFEPGDIVSAEDGVDDKKVVNGEIVHLPVATKAAAG